MRSGQASDTKVPGKEISNFAVFESFVVKNILTVNPEEPK